MKHFYLIVNREKENARRAAVMIAEYLTKRRCECLWWDQKDGDSPFGGESGQTDRAVKRFAEYRYTDSRRLPPETECVICLGGDGTLIQAARDLAGRELPLLGINMGHLGYLTQIAREEDILPAVGDLIEDRYRLESRMMLGGRVISDGKTVAEDIALNDIVLSRSGIDALRFSLSVNGQPFHEYSANGMIAATPTGSTAYNLSAGGPIAAPESELILLTPICPHTLNSRSIVLSPESRITLTLESGEDGKASVGFDGDTVVELKKGDRIEIERSEITTALVLLREIPFLENIRSKMRQI